VQRRRRPPHPARTMVCGASDGTAGPAGGWASTSPMATRTLPPWPTLSSSANCAAAARAVAHGDARWARRDASGRGGARSLLRAASSRPPPLTPRTSRSAKRPAAAAGRPHAPARRAWRSSTAQRRRCSAVGGGGVHPRRLTRPGGLAGGRTPSRGDARGHGLLPASQLQRADANAGVNARKVRRRRSRRASSRLGHLAWPSCCCCWQSSIGFSRRSQHARPPRRHRSVRSRGRPASPIARRLRAYRRDGLPRPLTSPPRSVLRASLRWQGCLALHVARVRPERGGGGRAGGAHLARLLPPRRAARPPAA